MPQQQLDYQTPFAKSTRRVTRRIVVIPAIILFGSETAFFVFLGATWSSQLAVDSQFSAHTDGLRLSVYLAWTAAFLLLLGTCAAIAEFIRGCRVGAERPAKYPTATMDRPAERMERGHS
jgi:hypothetical protein